MVAAAPGAGASAGRARSAYAARMSHPTDRPPPEAPTRPGWVPRRPVPADPDAGAPGAAGAGLWRLGARPSWAVAAGVLATAAVQLAAFQLRVVRLWPAMVALAAVSWWAGWHPYLPARLRPTWRLAAMGAVSGLGLYALTCGAALVVRATPLWPDVQDVAALARDGVPLAVAALVVVAGTSPAEEVLWRGAVFARLTRRFGPGWRPVAATTVSYAAVVGLSGSPTLLLAALPCGAVWARQRQVTGSLAPSVVSHAVWALLTLLYLPGLPVP
jgi:membrane protease YdiL (CAAX protease family)